jgi:hypothetical protein
VKRASREIGYREWKGVVAPMLVLLRFATMFATLAALRFSPWSKVAGGSADPPGL